jgi:hypothetical protein
MKIPLRNRSGDVVAHAVVSPEDFEEMSRYRWSLDGLGYVHRTTRTPEGKQKTVRMHRQVMGFPEGLAVDHRNHNLLDNTRENLRVCTLTQNQGNRRPKRNGTSRFLGVSRHRASGKWQAQITRRGKVTPLGIYADEEEAAKAYDVAARAYFGEFARPNFGEA